jgi:glycosyltransferase involved in cell wall biosynthesis
MTSGAFDDVWVVVAAYREEASIGGVIAELRQKFRAVVVVDDGSNDSTGMAATAAGAIVLSHPFNLGQGAALQTGISFALRQGAGYIATFDADGQHRVEDLEHMVEDIRTSGVDVVLGSRALGGSVGAPLVRRCLIAMALLHARLTTGLALTDAHNGLRVFTRAAAERIKIRQNRMAHASELLAQIAALKLRYKEHAVVIRYSAYSLKKGQRTLDSLTILFDLFFRRFVK